MCAASWGLRCGYALLRCLVGRRWVRGQRLACLRLACVEANDAAALQACCRWQVGVLLLPGFVAATWSVYRSERRLRLAFLASRGEAGARLARAMPSHLDFLTSFALPAALALWIWGR